MDPFKFLRNLTKIDNKDKKKLLQDMETGIAKLMEYPEWELYERYLTMRLQDALHNMLRCSEQLDFNTYAGRREGVLDAINAHKRVRSGRFFYEEQGENG